ncbi:MAG: DUF3237 family protein [Actinomycetota bacterium]|nr:DUF3237 family protein [Actinomycetota bacterium]
MTTTLPHDSTAATKPTYRFEGQFSTIVPIGPVADGFRLNGHFGGKITYGELAGADLVGLDYFRIRHDGTGIVTAHEVVTLDDKVVAVELHGYLEPPAGVAAPTPVDIVTPGFTWPTEPYTIHVAATFETAHPELAHLNTTIVAHTGAVNFADGTLVVEARRIG